MRRSCRNCKSYGYKCRYCFDFQMSISDVLNAGKCNRYKEKRKQVKGSDDIMKNSYRSQKRMGYPNSRKYKYFKGKFPKNIWY